MAMLQTSATATGGREGRVESEDYVIQFDTAMPGTTNSYFSPPYSMIDGTLIWPFS